MSPSTYSDVLLFDILRDWEILDMVWTSPCCQMEPQISFLDLDFQGKPKTLEEI